MKILVTGSDGLLGSHIVRELLADGYEVKTMVFPGSDSKTLEGLPIERSIGNICNPDDLRQAVEGCEAIIHAAASVKVWPTRSQDIWEVNLKGTQNVVDIVLEKKLKRLVYVSSANTFQHGSKSKPGTENGPFDGYQYRLDYIDSKHEAQEFVLKMVREKGLPAILVNPTYMFGEYDSKPGSGKLLLAVYKGSLPGFPPGGKNFVYAKDVARACVNALSKGRVGECYIAGHENLTYKELFNLIEQTIGGKPPMLGIPALFIRLYGYVGTLMGLLFRRAPEVNHAMAKVSCHGQYYSPQKAVAELNMPQTPLKEAIKATFNWLKANHYC